MAAEKKTDTGSFVDDAAQRIRELNEQIIDAARSGGTAYLDAYEEALKSIAGYQEQMASASPVEWIQRVVETQANFTREIGKLYASAARDLLK